MYSVLSGLTCEPYSSSLFSLLAFWTTSRTWNDKISTRKSRRAKSNENLERDDDVAAAAAVTRRLRGGGSRVTMDDEKGDDAKEGATDSDGFRGGSARGNGDAVKGGGGSIMPPQ